MAARRKGFQAKQSRRMSRQMDDSLLGTHVQRASHARRSADAASFAPQRSASRGAGGNLETLGPRSTTRESNAAYRRRTQQPGYIEGARRRSRARRVLTFLLAALVVLAVALVAGFLAFRGAVGSEMSLKNSDAQDALVSVRSDEPYYALVSVELGAAAEPLEQAGPDLVLLAYVDASASRLALVDIPSGLQVSVDNASQRLGDVAQRGDASLIRAVQNFAKVDISHFVKLERGDLEGMVDALGGIEVELTQVVDDPHAGDVYLPTGTYTLNGAGALTYLRATNLALGVTDQLRNQANFTSLLLAKLFSADGSFATRIEAAGQYFQTDLSLADLEALNGWLSGASASDIACTPLPGYMTSTAGVVDLGESRYVCTSEDMARIVEALEGGQDAQEATSDDVELVAPSSFTVEVQNGTDITGAASVTAEVLEQAGFRIAKTGNAAQQVYTETLVVYKTSDTQATSQAAPEPVYDEETGEVLYDEEGNPVVAVPEAASSVSAAGGNANGVGEQRAATVIDALGLGRAVEAGSYYTFDTDVLVIIGSDYKPVS